MAGRSLLIGYHVPLPDTQPERALTLQGERLEGLDPQLLALQPGYGGRPELGHAAVFGATRSGKSLHLTAQLGRWSGSFAALDIRGELYRRTAGLKARGGEVVVLSPEGVGARYDALSEIIATCNGYATAAEIIAARHEDQEKAFADRAASGIEAALRAAVRLGERPIPFLRRLVKEGGVKTFVETIYAVNDDETRVALNTFLDPNSGADFSPAKVLEDKFLVSSWGSMRNKLKPFLRAGVQSLFSGSDFSAADLMKRPTGVYLQFPEETPEATKTVYDLVVSSLLRGMMRFVDRERQGALPRVPVLVGLDEAATAPLADLKTLLATTASRGISALVYLQSPSQFDDLYGKNVTTSILANCSLELYYKIEDLATARYVFERCGKTSAPTEAKSQRRQLFAPPPTVSQSTTGREVLTVDEAMLVGGETRQVALGFVSGKRPLLFKRFNYYEHPWLDKLMAAYPAPELETSVPQSEPTRDPVQAPLQRLSRSRRRLTSNASAPSRPGTSGAARARRRNLAARSVARFAQRARRVAHSVLYP